MFSGCNTVTKAAINSNIRKTRHTALNTTGTEEHLPANPFTQNMANTVLEIGLVTLGGRYVGERKGSVGT